MSRIVSRHVGPRTCLIVRVVGLLIIPQRHGHQALVDRRKHLERRCSDAENEYEAQTKTRELRQYFRIFHETSSRITPETRPECRLVVSVEHVFRLSTFRYCYMVGGNDDSHASQHSRPCLGEDGRVQREARFVQCVGQHDEHILQQRDEELLVELRERSSGAKKNTKRTLIQHF